MTETQIKRKGKFRSLTYTLAVALIGLSLIILFFANGLQIYFNYQGQKEIIEAQQQLTAQKAATAVRSFVEQKFSVLETTTHFGELNEISSANQRIALQKLLGLEQSFRQLALFDANGTEKAYASRLSHHSQSSIIRNMEMGLLSEVSDKKRYTSQVYIDDVTSEPMIVLAVPINNIFGDFEGMLLAEVNLKFMWDLVAGIKVGENGLAYVVDKQGNLIAFNDVSRVLKGENLADIPKVNEFIHSGETGTSAKATASIGIQDTDVVSTYVPLDSPNWAVVIELPAVEAYAPIIQQIKISLLIVFLCILVSIIVSGYLSKRMTGSIIRLRDAANKFGEGELDTKIEVITKDEIGELAITFNQMAERLKESLKTLDDYNKNLEKTINERTVELQHAKQRFADIISFSPDATFVIDNSGKVIAWNKSVEDMTGVKASDIIGKGDYEYSLPFYGVRRPILIDLVNIPDGEVEKKYPSVKKDKDILTTEVFLRNVNGKNIYVSGRATPLYDVDGKVVGAIETVRDITQQKESTEELKRNNAALIDKETQILKINRKLEEANQHLNVLDMQKDEFISVAAHELKTPLTSIKGFTQLIQNDQILNDKEMTKHYLTLINQNTNRLYELILDIVDSSRLNLGKLSMHIESIDPYIVFKDIQENLELIIRNKGLISEFSIAEGLPNIRADVERLMQVLRNLISNSVKFTTQGTISLRVHRTGDGNSVQFEVKDTGQGIPEENKQFIFSRFYQVDSSMTRKVGGSGLGLSICKGFIENMGGKIWFESEAGKGSTFYFTVPIVESQIQQARPDANANQNSAGPGP